MTLTTATVAVLGLTALSSGHMIMNTPVSYGKSTLNNSPLAADGSDFPCKQRSGVYDAEGANNTLPLGSTQKLAFTGSATHGGGSCQVSITYDQNPTTSSTFKVIHSIEGGCPIRNIAGNNGDSADAVDPDTYNFTVPTSLPTGSATLAWTWFNKIGNREMFMNCAPISITAGSSSKRSAEMEQRDTAAYNALPNMFVANIGNGCGTVDSTDVLFPDPGDSVEQDGLQTSSALSTLTGSSCGSSVQASVSSTAGGSGSSASTAASQVSSAAAAPQVTSSPSDASTATTSADLAGGVFATVVSQTAPSASVETTIAASASAPVASAPVASATAAAAAAGIGTGTSSSSSSSSGALTGACTSEGMFNCIGGTSFQQCASGTWSVVQSVAAGTTCAAGQSANLNIAAVARRRRRALRFSG
jgi:hypothetical protein